MTDYDRDRGAYSPSGEAPLAFDARSQTRRGAGRPPTTLIISALILAALVIALVFYYRSGVRHSGEAPVVGEPAGDFKQPAPASAQPPDETSGLSIYSAQPSAPAASSAPPPAFAPPPEQPLPRPAPAHAPKASASAVLPPAPGAEAARPAPVLKPAAAAPKPAPAAVASVTPAPPKPAQVAAAAATSTGGVMVQIGAFSSPALADKGWNDVARLVPGQMVGRTKKVEPVSKDAETLYRAFVGGFASKAEAADFCTALKAASHNCIVK